VSELVLLEKDLEHRVAKITLNRPKQRNALSGALVTELNAAYDEVLDKDEIGCVVLTGADPAFCAGLDLREVGGGGMTTGLDFITRLWESSTVVIGAVNGAVATGGLELALACDWLLASEKAKFADTHVRVGLLPGAGMSVLLAQAVGVRKAREMSLTGRFVDAEEALAFGLVNSVVPHQELVHVAMAQAREVSAHPVQAMRQYALLLQENSRLSPQAGIENEREKFVTFLRSMNFSEVEQRRESVVEKGRHQAGS